MQKLIKTEIFIYVTFYKLRKRALKWHIDLFIEPFIYFSMFGVLVLSILS